MQFSYMQQQILSYHVQPHGFLQCSSRPDVCHCRSWAVSVTQVLLFAAPLSTMYKAIQARSSASMHLGMGILGFLGSAMWTIYGATISNFFILIPNLLGALLTLTALAICILFPR